MWSNPGVRDVGLRQAEDVKAVQGSRATPAAEPARVLELQRSIGNQRTAGLLTRRPRALARQGAVLNAVWGTIEEATFAGVRSHFAAAIDPDIAAAGQFQFTLLIAAKVQPVFDAMATEKWADDGERTQAVALWTAFVEQLFSGGYTRADVTRKALSELIRGAKSPEAAKLAPYLGTDAAAGYGAAAKLFQEHWKAGKGKPDVSARLTLAHLSPSGAGRRRPARRPRATRPGASRAAARRAGGARRRPRSPRRS